MDAYTSFAGVYDELMDNIPYEDWCEYLTGLLREWGIAPGQKIVELGCGTGNMTRLLAKEGYRMTGIDQSGEMLAMAMQKEDREIPVFYVEQDMTRLTLPGAVDAVISVCDSMNYITRWEDLCQVCKRVKRYLRKGGVFVFDMKTPYFYREICGDNIFAEDREDVSFIWDNCFDEESRINEYALSLFVPCREQGADLWRKFTEFHYQKAYDIQEVERAVKKSGLHLRHIYDAFTREPAKEDSQRLYYIVEK